MKVLSNILNNMNVRVADYEDAVLNGANRKAKGYLTLEKEIERKKISNCLENQLKSTLLLDQMIVEGTKLIQTLKEERAESSIERDPDLEYCDECGGVMRALWENNGYNEGEGPTHYEICGWKCNFCGITK